jgi:hypothetical protein
LITSHNYVQFLNADPVRIVSPVFEWSLHQDAKFGLKSTIQKPNVSSFWMLIVGVVEHILHAGHESSSK